MSRAPKRLYKYRVFNVNTLRLLDQAEVYYANPNSFNDPLDSNPTVYVDTDLSTLEKLLYRMLLEKEGKEQAVQKMGNHRYMSTEYGDYKTDPETAAYYTRRLASHVDDLLSQELGSHGVLSLARRWDCPLMWSHYADEHRGICIEYDLSDTEFSNLRAVSYNSPRAIKVSDLVAWKVNKNSEAKEKILRTFFFAKAPQWRYEHEWRDLSTSTGPSSAPAQISAVYFGLRCDYTVITTVVRLFANSTSKVKFFAIHPLESSFRLRRQLVDTDEIQATGVRTPAFLEFRDVFVDRTGA